MVVPEGRLQGSEGNAQPLSPPPAPRAQGRPFCEVICALHVPIKEKELVSLLANGMNPLSSVGA